jgi:hypothetical protein
MFSLLLLIRFDFLILPIRVVGDEIAVSDSSSLLLLLSKYPPIALRLHVHSMKMWLLQCQESKVSLPPARSVV